MATSKADTLLHREPRNIMSLSIKRQSDELAPHLPFPLPHTHPLDTQEDNFKVKNRRLLQSSSVLEHASSLQASDVAGLC